jgi:hypothetical protein
MLVKVNIRNIEQIEFPGHEIPGRGGKINAELCYRREG